MPPDPTKSTQRPQSVDDQIDQNLRLVFDTVAEQPIPTRFLDLLDQLRAQDANAPFSENTSVRPSSSGQEPDNRDE
nr:NepR family anti-sigma factor [Phaeobacter sp.]